VSLGDALRVFRRYPTPWLIGATLLAAVVSRVLVGGWELSDVVLPVGMLAVFPLVEWVIHVCILHWRPRRLAGRTVDSLLARKHREHHADPREVSLIFIPWPVLIWLVPVLVAISLLAFPRAGLGLTYLIGVAAIGLGYEWTHFLIHSDYRPKTRLYKAIWRNHRLHHYKNEHYWFTVTTAGTADRLLGTHPDPATIETSGTAKNLHAERV
jgi:hypothetical protein